MELKKAADLGVAGSHGAGGPADSALAPLRLLVIAWNRHGLVLSQVKGHIMTRSPSEHAKLIQREFTKQAAAYAANPTIIDGDWAGRLVQAVQPTPDSRVLDVATGPGYVALAFATVAREVVGVDLTDAPLGIARKNQAERGVKNVSFESADARQLPLEDGSFDIVVCRLAFHHLDSPKQVLSEMVRVCRPGGKIAVQDMIASEQTDRADYYNHWERLRDASHTRALSVGQLVALYGEAQLEIENLRWEQRGQDVELWMRNTETPHDTARKIHRLIQEDAAQEISGTPIFHDDEGRLCFMHRMVTVVGRRNSNMPAPRWDPLKTPKPVQKGTRGLLPQHGANLL